LPLGHNLAIDGGLLLETAELSTCKFIHVKDAIVALNKRLTASGLFLEGRPAGWAEVYRVFRECKFVEDEGNIVFYKNAMGLASSRPIIPGDAASDSGIELEK